MPPMKTRLRSEWNTAKDFLSIAAGWFTSADLSIFHDFDPPPTGGGHQFLRALWQEIERRGLRVENNRISRTTPACLMNSFNFRFARLVRMQRRGVLCVHRVDGPVGIYRGQDDSLDQDIWKMNLQAADRTIFQSRYSLEKHLELGMQFREPVVIPNAADPAIFHPRGRLEFSPGRRLRILASSWSNNLNKGARVYQWLDENLDHARFEFSFVGRSPLRFQNIRMLPPVTPHGMADLLRQHDIYLTASRNDPCSNSLIEALACGLPAVYLKSGGHPELVGAAGFGFDSPAEIPALLDRLVNEYETVRGRICIPALADVTTSYLKVLGLA